MRNQGPSEFIQAHELEDRLHQLLKADQDAKIRSLVLSYHPADLAAAMERVTPRQRLRVFNLLPVSKQGLVLKELSSRTTRQLLNSYPVEEIAHFVDQLPMDEAAKIVALFRTRRSAILKKLKPEHAADIQRLIRYPEHSAGRMMTEKFVRARANWLAGETIPRLRRMNAEAETLTNLYVVDGADRLLGVVSLREVVVAAPKKTLGKLMSKRIVSVTPETDREEVARLLSHYDYLAMPVLDLRGRMLGVIPVDDIIDVLAAESTEDILRFGGVEGGLIDQPYFNIPIKTVIIRRVGWLLLLFVAETLTGTVLRHFESELAAVVALSFFIPLLIGTGGNTGAQTVSTLIRGLALGEVRLRDAWKVISRELFSGFLIGAILGAVAYGRALVWGSSPALAATVGLSILAICTWSNTIGSLIPLMAQRFKIDPATVSAPLITTLVDATGLAIYLLIAKATLGI
jgi:magnesium transporter